MWRIIEFLKTYPRRNFTGGGIVVFLVVFGLIVISPPFTFPESTQVKIEEGVTLRDTANILKTHDVIRSTTLFMLLVRLAPGESNVLHGTYFFEEPQSVLRVVRRLMNGDFRLTPVSVVIHEGTSNAEIAEQLAERFPEFDADEFLRRARGDEGFLFPDTYRFLPTANARSVHQALSQTFEKKIASLTPQIEASDHTLHEIITMASLIEEETQTPRDRRLVSGILWKRLERGMPLQVDATFLYINGKNTFELTLDDLRNNDSPYNTYKYTGLPPGPITNPGLDSIKAALNPEESPYFYYLSDLESNIHYSRTFPEHRRKKALYLD